MGHAGIFRHVFFFLNDFEEIDILVDYFDDFAINLQKKTRSKKNEINKYLNEIFKKILHK